MSLDIPRNSSTPRPSLSRSSSTHSHSHSHSHSDQHSHKHDDGQEDGQHDEMAFMLSALTGGVKDKGSRITLIGLLANVALVFVKGVAGWALNSAALLADAGHSFSDLLGDFVVLFCWRFSRKPASDRYPFGYGKYESIGSLAVSMLLLLGAAGIGMHSFNLLQETLWPGHHHSHSSPSHSHSHSLLNEGPDHSVSVDPNAAWFALGSVLLKEYLYRITMRVAEEENSNVLRANALHHRSDAFSGLIALAAIGTSWLGLSMADPLGGLLVAFMILRQGLSLSFSSAMELLDASSDPTVPNQIKLFLEAEEADDVSSVDRVRTFKSGSFTMVELSLMMKRSDTQLKDVLAIRRRIESKVKEFLEGGVSEVLVSFELPEGKERMKELH